MDINITEKVIQTEDLIIEEKQACIVPAPIPEKSAWNVTVEVTEKISEVVAGKYPPPFNFFDIFLNLTFIP